MDEIIDSLVTQQVRAVLVDVCGVLPWVDALLSIYVQEVGDLTCFILKDLEESCPWMAHSIEQVYLPVILLKLYE